MQDKPSVSSFVTVLAWIFIILTGFSTFIAVLQNIMVQVMFSAPDMHRALADSGQDKNMPLSAQFMFNNFRWFFLAFLVLSAITFVSSIGLLKRKNWARVFFIAIMALGIVWNIGGFALQLAMFSSMPQMPQMPPGTADAFQSQFDSMFTVMIVFSAVMALGLSVLFGWIIRRLMSLPIRHEFGVGL